MAVEVIDTIKPKNGGDFPIVEAEDVRMPDGTRLSDLSTTPKLADGASEIQPDRYYVFGEISGLDLTLVEADDGKAHEYCFEFIPAEDFTGLTITPEVRWVSEPQYPAGKTCQVSILRGLAVMGCA